jgi:hypothetical protein
VAGVKLLAVLAGYLGPWVWAAVLGLLVASHATVGLWVRAEVTERYELREASAKAAHEKALRIEQGKQRDIEALWHDRADAAQKELNDARKTIDEQGRHLAGLRLDAGRLRDQLTSYAAGSPGEDSVAACHARAAALSTYAADIGAAASEIAVAARQSAIERDEFAAEVSALIKAWPRAGER